jgi:small subunit ribosomal protein S20
MFSVGARAVALAGNRVPGHRPALTRAARGFIDCAFPFRFVSPPLGGASWGAPSGAAADVFINPSRTENGEHSSAKKATRKIARRTAVNRSRRSRMRTFVRKVEEAIASGDQQAAAAALTNAESILMRASQKGIIHKNTASRKVSRLTHRVQTLSAAK